MTSRKALLVLAVLVLAHAATQAAGSPQVQQQPAESPAQAGTQSQATFGAITPYLGLAIDQIELPAVPPEEAASLLAVTPLKIGEPLTREALHDAMQALFATGRFADIQAEADRTDTAGVRLRFLTTANFFVGIVTIEGVSSNPSPNQLASATRLQLGELYAPDFLFDWYWYSGVKLMEEALENGFLKAPNRKRLKFALMWANHRLVGCWCLLRYDQPRNSWLPIPD